MTNIPDDKPKMYILAGPNGSGKSTFLKKEFPPETIHLDADEFSREIAKERYPDIPNDEIQALIDSDISLQIGGSRRLRGKIKENIKNGLSFSAETTLSGKSYETHINNAKLNGFKINLLYVGTQSPDINVLRVSQRASEGKHDVPVETIENRYNESLKRLSDFIKLSDKVKVYDNSIYGKEARLILSIEQGKIIDVNKPIPKWVNDSVNEKLYPDLYEETRKDSKKEALRKVKELDKDSITVNAQMNASITGNIIAKTDYFVVQKYEGLENKYIIHEIDKVPELHDCEIGERVTIEYDHAGNGKIVENTHSDENSIELDDDLDIGD